MTVYITFKIQDLCIFPTEFLCDLPCVLGGTSIFLIMLENVSFQYLYDLLKRITPMLLVGKLNVN